jgi:16S rRNA (cytosine1402-N4)-methyltransferase
MLVEMSTHVPVLAGELVGLLDPQPGEVAIDCTFGAGGHARLVGDRLGPGGELIAIDRDPAAEVRFDELAAELHCRTRFIHAPFAEALEQLRDEGVRADLVYLDLGMSSMQVDTRERGFSYSYDAPLDMRMDPEDELSAADVVNTWDERRLATLFRDYGEERYARPIARAVARARADAPLETTNQLVEVVVDAVPAPARFAAGHPAKRVFQAIRIAVNDELGQLDAALPAAWELLRVHGRFAGISFHSLEDRRVKRFLVARARGCICPPDFPVCACGRVPEAELLTRRAVAATPGEVAANPRAKSARMRAARKLEETHAGRHQPRPPLARAVAPGLCAATPPRGRRGAPRARRAHRARRSPEPPRPDACRSRCGWAARRCAWAMRASSTASSGAGRGSRWWRSGSWASSSCRSRCCA